MLIRSDRVSQVGGFNEPFFEASGNDHPGGAEFAAVDASVHFPQ